MQCFDAAAAAPAADSERFPLTRQSLRGFSAFPGAARLGFRAKLLGSGVNDHCYGRILGFVVFICDERDGQVFFGLFQIMEAWFFYGRGFVRCRFDVRGFCWIGFWFLGGW